jgi:hypothetical protein
MDRECAFRAGSPEVTGYTYVFSTKRSAWSTFEASSETQLRMLRGDNDIRSAKRRDFQYIQRYFWIGCRISVFSFWPFWLPTPNSRS